jgi:lipopolysaccharide biosynthesis regulator YciM
MSSDFMLTAEELRLQRQKRKRLFIALVVVLVLVLGAVFGGRPILHAIKAWQARRHAQQAFVLIEKEQWNDARKEATTAHQLWSEEPEAIRAVARFLSRTRQAQALEFWEHLEKAGRLTRTDLVDEASIALLAGDDARAKRAIAALLSGKEGPVKPVDHLLEAQLAIRQGAPIEAHDALQKVFGDPAATNREKLQATLLELAIAGGGETWRDDAWSWLKKLADESDAAGLDALTVLTQTIVAQEKVPENFPVAAPELAQKLEAHPLARAPQKLLAIDLRIREQKEPRDELIAQAIERWKTGEPEEMAALATWLNGKGEFQRMLDAIPREKALQSRDLFLQHLDALGGLGRWKDIKGLLDRDTFPLDPVVQKMYLARCNAQLGEKAASENNWQRALEAAQGDPNKLLMVASYAEKNGALEVARAAYAEAAAESPKLRAAHQGRLRLAQATNETRKIHDVLAEMLAIWPNDPAVQNDEAYTRLLLLSSQQSQKSEDGSQRSEPTPAAGDTPAATGERENAQRPTPNAQRPTSETQEPITNNEELRTIEQLAAQLVQREPSSLPHRTLLALARLRLGKFSDALDAYSNIQVSRGALTPSALAVHAAVLAANGRLDDAASEIRDVDPKRLLPEEAVLVENIHEESRK